jgi:hypothetical protein
VTGPKASVDFFGNAGSLTKIVINGPSGQSTTIVPRAEAPDCSNFLKCREIEITSGNSTTIQRSLDDHPMGTSRLWEMFSPQTGKRVFQACSGGTIFTARSRSEVEAALAAAGGKAPASQDMIIDPGSGSAVPSDVVANATPFCDWTLREKKFNEAVNGGLTASADAANIGSSSASAPPIAHATPAWQLMLPPISSGPGGTYVAPIEQLSMWSVEQTFSSAQECNRALAELKESSPTLYGGAIFRQRAEATCVASDDPRLKNN